MEAIISQKPSRESKVSWNAHTQRRLSEKQSDETQQHRRYLKHHHHDDDDSETHRLQQKLLEAAEKKEKKKERKREKKLAKLLANPGIRETSTHGMMIDAGSTGSRLHLYEYEPRVLETLKQVESAVAGKKLTFPGSESRWTDKLRPGLATFAEIENDEEMEMAVKEYLSPLIDFAKDVLHSKADEYHTFPIYLKATAGMRTLSNENRARVITAVRKSFHNKTFCPFSFEDERARVISGEEEAIYGWAGVNFLMGTLLSNTEGSGTVINPKKTYGALDMGGASTQISYWSSEDIMTDLFKLQIGAAKHWNAYAHSFLYFGINEAFNRMGARLVSEQDGKQKVTNPCLPGKSSLQFTSRININSNGVEYYPTNSTGNYNVTLVNNSPKGDFIQCSDLARSLLRKENNDWCDFAFDKDCSFSGVYQPKLPTQNADFGEFLAFSNYYHVWDFLGLESRSSLRQLRDRTKEICAMNLEDLLIYNDNRDNSYEYDDVIHACFHASYVFEILYNGYGFGIDDNITATEVVNNQKVGWALGSMLYEINALPWTVGRVKIQKEEKEFEAGTVLMIYVIGLIISILVGVLFVIKKRRGGKKKDEYQMIECAYKENHPLLNGK